MKHLNAAGGVLGQPVEVAVGDSTRDPMVVAVAEARRLVEDEGIHALVARIPAPIRSGRRAGDRAGRHPDHHPVRVVRRSLPRLPTATFCFAPYSPPVHRARAWRVTREHGFDNVGVIYRDDAWGAGLAAALGDAWDGEIAAVGFGPAQTTLLAELQRTAAAGAQALVVIAFETDAVMIVREAIDHDLYRQFTFDDAARSPAVVREIGGERLIGMYGPPERPHRTTGLGRLDAAFVAEYGQLPAFAYVKETYDAAISLALAAQAAGSTRGAPIRDQLRAVGSAPGTVPGRKASPRRCGSWPLAERSTTRAPR